ncbi:hypothetical protein CPAR01_09305 [Colletotrichum paranaense]|uniref:Uncharacterized protein n=1 Tax=Colletotrichum paranaense TaxID=1914294 RepID=A0ABQ9SGD9_9PEZI|nr:uncharacterized protein CPAR01_09305 [Colletotrichum paranaense]KAK1535763.1 hypothetical protein CPAR01_09305 [Colletotrichum paranaense]
MTGGQPQTWFFLAGSDIRKMHEFGRHWLQNSSKAEVSTTNAIDVAWTDDAADSEAETSSSAELTVQTFMTLMYREFWTYLADFRSEYQEKFKADPYVCKVIQYLWDKGKLISQDRWQEAVDEVLLHNTWFLEHLLNDEKTIMIVPRYKLDYRDEYLSVPENRGFEGFDSNLHTSLTGVTNLIVPVSQYESQSQVSGRKEYLPVSLSVMGLKDIEGINVELLSLVHDYLAETGLPSSVMTGRTAF